MKQKGSDLKFMVVDACSMPFADASFDVLIDKATSDAILLDSKEYSENHTKMNGEIYRVLNKGGKWIVFSRRPTTEIRFVNFKMIHNEKREDSTKQVYYFYVLEKE